MVAVDGSNAAAEILFPREVVVGAEAGKTVEPITGDRRNTVTSVNEWQIDRHLRARQR